MTAIDPDNHDESVLGEPSAMPDGLWESGLARAFSWDDFDSSVIPNDESTQPAGDLTAGDFTPAQETPGCFDDYPRGTDDVTGGDHGNHDDNHL